MSRRLPPLNALRAFEAAARHMSFTDAAAELHVTPAAVGHQVKSLEERLGVPLFRRLNRRLLLTDAGQAGLKPLSEALDKLAEAAEAMQRQNQRGILTVSVAPSFAAKWLVRRLGRFAAQQPDIDVRIDTDMMLSNLTRGDVDMAIRYGPGAYPGCRSDKLVSDQIFPVCSPSLRDGPPRIRAPEDLRHQTLLHESWENQDPIWPTWRMWLTAAGVADIDPERGPQFPHSSLALDAAVEGHGVALASDFLVADDLASGRLVQPFDLGLCPKFSYFVVSPTSTADSRKVAAFRDWILAEAGKSAAGENQPNR